MKPWDLDPVLEFVAPQSGSTFTWAGDASSMLTFFPGEMLYYANPDATGVVGNDTVAVNRIIACHLISQFDAYDFAQLRPVLLRICYRKDMSVHTESLCEVLAQLPNHALRKEIVYPPNALIDASILSSLEKLDRENPSVDLLSKAIEKIDIAISVSEFEKIDVCLADADPSKLSIAAMIALLRVPFMFRAKLNHWNDFKQRVENEMKERGKDHTRLLRGLG